jgi:hypothetical protein
MMSAPISGSTFTEIFDRARQPSATRRTAQRRRDGAGGHTLVMPVMSSDLEAVRVMQLDLVVAELV